MTALKEVNSRQLFMGRLAYGEDLLDEITAVCTRENIRLGRIEAIGAVQRARMACYNQKTHEYRFFTIDQPLEIAQLTGNVSIRQGQPMVHAHLTLADDAGNAYGGHLAPGTVIFACEIIIEALEGPEFIREFDEETGLTLWHM
ncbi:MAG: DNA-binding protein [Desulfobacterales bacterium]|nr:DNA-binding protein [Desulfobacterales bacterium]